MSMDLVLCGMMISLVTPTAVEVVTLYGNFGLWSSHFDECLAQWDHFFGDDEEACQFSFKGR